MLYPEYQNKSPFTDLAVIAIVLLFFTIAASLMTIYGVSFSEITGSAKQSWLHVFPLN